MKEDGSLRLTTIISPQGKGLTAIHVHTYAHMHYTNRLIIESVYMHAR